MHEWAEASVTALAPPAALDGTGGRRSQVNFLGSTSELICYMICYVICGDEYAREVILENVAKQRMFCS